jgi:hypothetical protein
LQNVKKIACPSCGAASSFKLNNHQYKCNYCQTEFELENTNTAIEETKKRYEEIKQAYTVKKSPASCLIVVFIVVAFGIGIIAFSILTRSDNVKKLAESGYKEIIQDNWQKPSLYASTMYYGEKGPIIINILKQQTNSLDSARILAEIIYPKTNNKTITSPLLSDNWKHLTFEESSFFSNISVIDNILYTFGKDSGLIGYNVYSFKQVVFSNTLKKTFISLQSGVHSVEKNYDGGFKITNNDADVFFFFPNENKLLTEKEYNDRRYKKALPVSTVFFTYSKRPFLVKATQKTSNIDNSFTISLDDTTKLKQDRSWLASAYGLTNIKVLGKTVYHRLKIIRRYQLGLLVAYSESMDSKAPIILSYINKEGETVWKNTNPNLQELNSSRSDDALNFEATVFGNDLLISTYSYPKQFFGFNLQNGQQLWTYQNEK